MTKPAIKPCGHHVLLRPLEWEQRTESGIYLTPTEDSQGAKLEKAGRMYGILVAVGPQAWKAHDAALVKSLPDRFLGLITPGLGPWAIVGDTVMYSRYAGKGVFDPNTGEEYYLIHDEDILAVLPPKDEWKYLPTEKGKQA